MIEASKLDESGRVDFTRITFLVKQRLHDLKENEQLQKEILTAKERSKPVENREDEREMQC